MLDAMQPIELQAVGSTPVMFGDVDWLQKQVFWWNKFASVKELSACRPLCKHEIALLEARATDLGMYMPVHFKYDSLIHKFHVVTCEMHRSAKLMARKGISPGMGNEQAIEVMLHTHTHTHTHAHTHAHAHDVASCIGYQCQD
jgi:hypothetical protein